MCGMDYDLAALLVQVIPVLALAVSFEARVLSKFGEAHPVLAIGGLTVLASGQAILTTGMIRALSVVLGSGHLIDADLHQALDYVVVIVFLVPLLGAGVHVISTNSEDERRLGNSVGAVVSGVVVVGGLLLATYFGFGRAR